MDLDGRPAGHSQCCHILSAMQGNHRKSMVNSDRLPGVLVSSHMNVPDFVETDRNVSLSSGFSRAIHFSVKLQGTVADARTDSSSELEFGAKRKVRDPRGIPNHRAQEVWFKSSTSGPSSRRRPLGFHRECSPKPRRQGTRPGRQNPRACPSVLPECAPKWRDTVQGRCVELRCCR